MKNIFKDLFSGTTTFSSRTISRKVYREYDDKGNITKERSVLRDSSGADPEATNEHCDRLDKEMTERANRAMKRARKMMQKMFDSMDDLFK